MNFDYNKLLKSAGGDEKLSGELIGIFLNEYPGMLDRINLAIRDSQPQQLHEGAHILKGPLGNMGAFSALDQVVALETMGINEDLQQADVALERLNHQIDLLVQDLKKHDKAHAE